MTDLVERLREQLSDGRTPMAIKVETVLELCDEIERRQYEVERLVNEVNRLRKVRKEAEAEVERLTVTGAEWMMTFRERAEKAEAEIERLTKERDSAKAALLYEAMKKQ